MAVNVYLLEQRYESDQSHSYFTYDCKLGLLCNWSKSYSTFFAQSGGLLRVMNTQLVMMVHMITTLNNLQAVIKDP